MRLCHSNRLPSSNTRVLKSTATTPAQPELIATETLRVLDAQFRGILFPSCAGWWSTLRVRVSVSVQVCVRVCVSQLTVGEQTNEHGASDGRSARRDVKS